MEIRYVDNCWYHKTYKSYGWYKEQILPYHIGDEHIFWGFKEKLVSYDILYNLLIYSEHK